MLLRTDRQKQRTHDGGDAVRGRGASDTQELPRVAGAPVHSLRHRHLSTEIQTSPQKQGEGGHRETPLAGQAAWRSLGRFW